MFEAVKILEKMPGLGETQGRGTICISWPGTGGWDRTVVSNFQNIPYGL